MLIIINTTTFAIINNDNADFCLNNCFKESNGE